MNETVFYLNDTFQRFRRIRLTISGYGNSLSHYIRILLRYVYIYTTFLDCVVF